VTEYTRLRAQTCDGSQMRGELAIDYIYSRAERRWRANARASNGYEVGSPIFDILAGVTPAELRGDVQEDGRPAYVLTAAWKLPAGAQRGSPDPPGMTQSLWIDAESMWPIRWSVSVPAADAMNAAEYTLSFVRHPPIDVRRPPRVTQPLCIGVKSRPSGEPERH
jgi:hypothetical protein